MRNHLDVHTSQKKVVHPFYFRWDMSHGCYTAVTRWLVFRCSALLTPARKWGVSSDCRCAQQQKGKHERVAPLDPPSSSSSSKAVNKYKRRRNFYLGRQDRKCPPSVCHFRSASPFHRQIIHYIEGVPQKKRKEFFFHPAGLPYIHQDDRWRFPFVLPVEEPSKDMIIDQDLFFFFVFFFYPKRVCRSARAHTHILVPVLLISFTESAWWPHDWLTRPTKIRRCDRFQEARSISLYARC